MNIHFHQVERKTPFASYWLAAFGIFTALILTLNFSHHAELHWSAPSTSVQVIHAVENNLPVAVPAPLPPAGSAQAAATPEPVGAESAILVPQVIPAPHPSVP